MRVLVNGFPTVYLYFILDTLGCLTVKRTFSLTTPLNGFILSGNSSLISIIYTDSSVQVILKGQKSRDKLALCPRLSRASYTNQKSLNARGAGSSWLDSGLPPWDTGVLTWFRGWRPDSRALLARWKRSGLWAFQVGPPRPFTISIRWNTVAQTLCLWSPFIKGWPMKARVEEGETESSLEEQQVGLLPIQLDSAIPRHTTTSLRMSYI